MGILFRGNWLERRPLLGILRRMRTALLVRGIWIDEEIDRMEEEKRKEWEKRGIPERYIVWGIQMAKGWAEKMIEFLTRDLPPELADEVARKMAPTMFKRALDEVAEAWIRKMTGI